MDPMTMAAIAAGLNIAGGMFGANAQKEAQEKQMKLLRQFYKEVDSLAIPDQEKLQYALERFKSVGQLDPRLAGPSAQQAVTSDPRLVEQQMKNLQEMQAIADAGGYDPAVQADLRAALRQQEQATKAAQQSIEQQAQARGMASTGATRALQQMAGQSEANRTADLQSRLAAEAYRNRMAAMSGASAEAARLRSSGYQESMSRAQAMDEIARFNLNMQNEAAAKNLAAQQALSEANTRLGQEEEKRRVGALKDIFDMQSSKLGLKANATTGQASVIGKTGEGLAKSYQTIGAGAGDIFAAFTPKTKSTGTPNYVEATDKFFEEAPKFEMPSSQPQTQRNWLGD